MFTTACGTRRAGSPTGLSGRRTFSGAAAIRTLAVVNTRAESATTAPMAPPIRATTATTATDPARACLLSRRAKNASPRVSRGGGGSSSPDRSAGSGSPSARTAGAPTPTAACGSRQGSGGGGAGVSASSCQAGCRAIPRSTPGAGANAWARAGSSSRGPGPLPDEAPARGTDGSNPPVTPSGRANWSATASLISGLWTGAGSRRGRSGSGPRRPCAGSPVWSSTRPTLTAEAPQAAEEPRPGALVAGPDGLVAGHDRLVLVFEGTEPVEQLRRHADRPGPAEQSTSLPLVVDVPAALPTSLQMRPGTELARPRQTAVDVRGGGLGGQVVGRQE